MPHLSLPDIRFKDSFLAALTEYQAENQLNYRTLNPDELKENFQSYVEQLHKESHGEALQPGHVAHTLFWLVEDNEYIGRVDIRHELNDFLLKEGGHIGYDIRPTQRRKGYGKIALELGIHEAKKIGINAVLITCNVDNIGSNKIIQANGGVLENTVELGEGKPAKNRYWVSA